MLRSVLLMIAAPPPCFGSPIRAQHAAEPLASTNLAGATPARSEASTGGQALSRSGGGNPISGEWAYSEAGVGVGIWSAALMGGTAIATLGSAGLGTLVGLGSASAGSAAGRGLGNALAGMLGAGPGDVSVSMPSSVAKGSGQPTGSAGAKGQRGAPGGAVGADRANQLKDALDQYDRENLLAENGEGGTSGMGGHEGASGTGEAQQMGEMPEWAGDVAMCMVPLPMGSLKLLGRLVARAAAPSSRALARALAASGIGRPAGAAAHHIVAGGARIAAPARAVLERFGIGINEAANGVFLQQSGVHAGIHTTAYYEAVNSALAQATTRGQALEALGAIRQAILNGGFP